MMATGLAATSTSSPTSIASRGLEALVWGSIGSGLRIVLQIAAQIALARLVGPDQYGLFASAQIALAIASFFADIGLAYSLIQKPEISARDIAFVCTWQILLGTVASLTLFALAGTIAGFFSNPAIKPIIEVLSIVCLINALTAPSINLLKREMRFRSMQLAGVCSYFVSYLLIGIGLALAGAGVWALVAAFMANALISLGLMYRSARHPLALAIWPEGAASMLRYGATVLFTNLGNWAVSSLDRTVVGHVFSTTAVGFYSSAYNLVSSPAYTLAGILQPALFSASARAQGQTEQLKRALLAGVAASSTLFAPVFLCIGLVSDTVVLALYGEAWLPSAALLRPMAFSMPCLIMLSLATPSLWVAGKIRQEFVLQLPVVVVALVGFWYASHYSIVAVAWMLLALCVLRVLIIVTAAARILGLGIGEMLGAMRGGLLLCVVTGGLCALADAQLTVLEVGPIMRLLLVGAISATAMLGMLVCFPSVLHPTLQRLLHILSPRLPAPICRLLERFLERGGK